MSKKEKSLIKKVLNKKEGTKKWLLVIQLIGAFFLDFLRLIKNIIIISLISLFGIGTIVAIILWIKIEPTYTQYSNLAQKTVNKSTYETFIPEQSTYIYDSEENIIAKLKGEKDAIYLPYKDIPKYAIDAFIAVEDRTFWTNEGIDIKGIIRVGVDFIKTKGEEMHGASTITQQLARNIFLTHEVSIERKAKEILIAINLTNKYSKNEIMEFYVNNICFSNGIYGLEAASINYFNKPSSELTLSQLCYLCAIPNAPEYYNPYKNPERAIVRRDKILGDMLEEGCISKIDYEEAIKEEIILEKPEINFNNYQATYAIDCATRFLMEKNGFEFKYDFVTNTEFKNYKKLYEEEYQKTQEELKSSGYRIYTTLNSSVQTKMQQIIDEELAFNQEKNSLTNIYSLQSALTVIDNDTGKVIALVGGRTQENEDNLYTLNRAYQGYRQPGSTFKPLVVYTPALMSGFTKNTTVYNIDVSKAKEKDVNVQELTGTPMRLQTALEQSKNGVAWQIFDKLGPLYTMSFVSKMQFSNISPDDYFNSSSLGGLTYGTTTTEMAAAYATLQNHGQYREATCLNQIIDPKGKNIYTEKETVEVYSAKASDVMTEMMTGVLTSGTAAKLKWYNETKMIAACKTGTTNDSKDGWLCGYTPYYTVSVWVGYDIPKTLDDLYGATYPGQIWKKAMLSLIDKKEIITEFEKAEYPEEESPSDLPLSAYEKYLPGRSDSEILSDNYTVYDYRSDRVIGEKVTEVINKINALDESDPLFIENINSLYDEGNSIIETIYSRKYTTEMQTKLNESYNLKLQ